MLLSYIASNTFKKRFKQYSKIPSPNGMTGYDTAVRMLSSHGITDVKVEATRGHLSDHYNPTTKTIKLSEAVYYGHNLSSLAIAAHECGHAIQHANSYTWLNLRSQLVPMVELSSRWMHWVILAGVLLINTFPQLLLVGILLFALTTLFSFITLPVEIDASKRALAWLSNAGITNIDTQAKAKSALQSAAYTYIVAALGSLATLAYYLMIYMGVDD